MNWLDITTYTLVDGTPQEIVDTCKKSLALFFRYLKEIDRLNLYRAEAPSVKVLLGVMYHMRTWEYDFPCPLQHSNAFASYRFETYDTYWRYVKEGFKKWCRKNHKPNYRVELRSVCQRF